jgi:hypothetical protein
MKIKGLLAFGQFGDRWPDVQHVMNEFRRIFGMLLLDINPENITLGEDDARG